MKKSSIFLANKDQIKVKKIAGEHDVILGRMKYKGPFGGSISYHGLPIDILKSGIQKYVRRGKSPKALWCMVEYDI